MLNAFKKSAFTLAIAFQGLLQAFRLLSPHAELSEPYRLRSWLLLPVPIERSHAATLIVKTYDLAEESLKRHGGVQHMLLWQTSSSGDIVEIFAPFSWVSMQVCSCSHDSGARQLRSNGGMIGRATARASATAPSAHTIQSALIPRTNA